MTEKQTRIPSLMQIITATAKAANLTICDLMGTERFTNVINARAAFYKIASSYGYHKHDIMECIDRNRTVGYNYEANINGHLFKDRRFIAMCARTEEILRKYPYRVVETPQQREKRQNLICSIHVAERQKQKTERIPNFIDYKSPLGWFFTADDMRQAYNACKEAEKWHERTYANTKSISAEPSKQIIRLPTEMATQEAAIFLDISVGLLVKGVQKGLLQRFKKPYDARYWYHTNELIRYKEYLANIRRR